MSNPSESGTEYMPIYAESALIKGTGSGPSAVQIDLSGSAAVASSLFRMSPKSATVAEASDKIIIKAPAGYFNSGPTGTWSNVKSRAFFIGGFGIDGELARSADGSTAVVTVKPSHMWHFCHSGSSKLQIFVEGNDAAKKTAATYINVGAPACTQSFGDVPTSGQFYK